MREPPADDRDPRGTPVDSSAGAAADAADTGGPAPSVADAGGPADAPGSAAPECDSDGDGDGDGDEVTIRVARSGGIAGMTRRWRVVPSRTETERWVSLLERCPWDEDPGSASGADRFQWRIEAQIRQVRHEQVIPEEHLSGPWRDLVDAVREAAQD
ncbi:protealysin inhibitor emfourin [Microbacterium sp. 22242]|uniref:protealysin inhibitor emfourin n=1 Tax=Microbacterium sp. 22242 TaxID=3453896 RepID=UPI003F830618